MEHKNRPLYTVVGCPLFRGRLKIEVNGRIVGAFVILCVSVVEGCPLSGVSLHSQFPKSPHDHSV